jgi:F0F1-type ATP synthase epsilon subunit
MVTGAGTTVVVSAGIVEVSTTGANVLVAVA